MTLHCYILICFIANICSSSRRCVRRGGGFVYPQSGLWRCGGSTTHPHLGLWRMCDKGLTDLHVHMP